MSASCGCDQGTAATGWIEHRSRQCARGDEQRAHRAWLAEQAARGGWCATVGSRSVRSTDEPR